MVKKEQTKQSKETPTTPVTPTTTVGTDTSAPATTTTNPVNAPSTSKARATTDKVGEFGGYGTVEEFAQKDPRGFEQHLQDNVKGYIK